MIFKYLTQWNLQIMNVFCLVWVLLLFEQFYRTFFFVLKEGGDQKKEAEVRSKHFAAY